MDNEEKQTWINTIAEWALNQNRKELANYLKLAPEELEELDEYIDGLRDSGQVV